MTAAQKSRPFLRLWGLFRRILRQVSGPGAVHIYRGRKARPNPLCGQSKAALSTYSPGYRRGAFPGLRRYSVIQPPIRWRRFGFPTGKQGIRRHQAMRSGARRRRRSAVFVRLRRPRLSARIRSHRSGSVGHGGLADRQEPASGAFVPPMPAQVATILSRGERRCESD